MSMGKGRKSLALLLMLALLASLLTGCAVTTVSEAPAQNSQSQSAPVQDELVLLPADETTEEAGPAEATAEDPAPTTDAAPDEDGSYTTKEDVLAYLIAYGHLPANFISKNEARAAGWEGGSLERYCPGKCIGGDRFGNREGLLPSARGRVWTECDINTLGKKSRGAERLVFSNDGLIYYTGDHYESFELLYGEP
jgi:hypothetical protein